MLEFWPLLNVFNEETKFYITFLHHIARHSAGIYSD